MMTTPRPPAQTVALTVADEIQKKKAAVARLPITLPPI
jgi:hypothetical protein